MDNKGRFYVLDVNANCSIDFDSSSAMHLILQTDGCTYPEFFKELLQYGFERKFVVNNKKLLNNEGSGSQTNIVVAVAAEV